MDYDRHVCPVLDVDGVIASGKQFDLDIRLPEDDRNVIYGVIKDCYGDPVRDAVVKLVEVVCECGKEERRPVSHTFTDKEGEFVFGPLCANKFYEIQIWVDETTRLSLKFYLPINSIINSSISFKLYFSFSNICIIHFIVFSFLLNLLLNSFTNFSFFI